MMYYVKMTEDQPSMIQSHLCRDLLKQQPLPLSSTSTKLSMTMFHNILAEAQISFMTVETAVEKTLL